MSARAPAWHAGFRERLTAAIHARAGWLDGPHDTAFRLFNGFTEGAPVLALDVYATTLVVHNHADPPETGATAVAWSLELVRARLPWLRAGLVKTRHAAPARDRRGVMAFGEAPDRGVQEDGVRYAIDLRMNRDCSFYLDTRELRRWIRGRLRGASVLNAFAYTGTLGMAALAGGAASVVQLDRNPAFLRLARESCRLNGGPVGEHDLLAGDFWREVSRAKRAGRRFDCVLLDPPFFATAATGTVDLARNSARLINKVRPLIHDGGRLVAVNNALFVSGRDYLATLEGLCADGYLALEELIPVPPDVVGPTAPHPVPAITDPAPFNHSTKIAVLRVRRKAP